MFSMPKRRTFEHFLASSEDSFFLVEKEDMFSKRRTYGKPTLTLNLNSLLGIQFFKNIEKFTFTA